MSAPLHSAVTAAIGRAAIRISDQTVENEGCRAISPSRAEELIAEELTPVLTAPWPLGIRTGEPEPLITLHADAFLPRAMEWRGCIGTRYCHACRISYGGTCLCMPNKCHVCGAECGTTPPVEGTTYEHRMHY